MEEKDRQRLTIGEGFRFGIGFTLAPLFIAAVAGVVSAVFSLLVLGGCGALLTMLGGK